MIYKDNMYDFRDNNNDDMHCEINSERFLASVYVL